MFVFNEEVRNTLFFYFMIITPEKELINTLRETNNI